MFTLFPTRRSIITTTWKQKETYCRTFVIIYNLVMSRVPPPSQHTYLDFYFSTRTNPHTNYKYIHHRLSFIDKSRERQIEPTEILFTVPSFIICQGELEIFCFYFHMCGSPVIICDYSSDPIINKIFFNIRSLTTAWFPFSPFIFYVLP